MSPFIVNVLDMLNVDFAADVNLLNAVATDPCVFEFALIAVSKAAAVLFPEVRSEDKVAARAFCPLILISFAAKFELL